MGTVQMKEHMNRETRLEPGPTPASTWRATIIRIGTETKADQQEILEFVEVSRLNDRLISDSEVCRCRPITDVHFGICSMYVYRALALS